MLAISRLSLLFSTLVALIAEDEEIKELLASKGIQSQTVEEVAPIRILPAKCLVRLYNSLGKYSLESRPKLSYFQITDCNSV